MAPADARTRLAELARWPSQDAPVVSVYLDTRWTDEQQRERARIFLKNELRRAGDAGRARPEDLDWIEREAEGLIAQQTLPEASGVALFACAAAGLREMLPMRVAFEPAFVVNARPYLPPLAAALDEAPPVLVVFVDGTVARLIPLTATGPGEELVLETPVEGRHSTGGWAALAQSRYQRHIEEHRGQHYAAVAAAVDEWSARESARWIVMAGEPRAVGLCRQHFPERLATRIAGMVPGTQYEPAAALAQRAADLVARLEQSDEASAVDAALAEAARGGPAVDDVERALDAVNRGAVRHLYLARDLREVGRQCQGCQALQRGLAGRCGYCGRETDPVELEEVMVDRVIATGGAVTMVDRHGDLARRGGVVAVLRYAA